MRTKINDYDWQEVQQFYNTCHSQIATMRHFTICRTVLQKAKKLNKIICRERPRHTQETKKLLSEKAKQYFKGQKHSWKRKSKFYSTPCELFKQFLRQNNISFCEEYKCPQEWKRNFAIDIAFINEKIGIQINGNQHYQRSGQLKLYYQQRHDILQRAGWKIYEIPYLMVWNTEFKARILRELKQQVNISFDYSEFIRQRLQQKQLKLKCPICGGYKKTREAKICASCARTCERPNRRKVQRPSKQILEKQIRQNSFVSLGKKYGVSDNAIRKWCLAYNIDI